MRKDVLLRMQRYCDYQDRSHQEVRLKLLSLKVYGDELEEVMGSLIDSGHLHEERYARSLARGKFRIKGWGRLRILQHLRQQQIGDYLCKKALEEIDPEEYEIALQEQLTRRLEQLPADAHPAQLRQELRKWGVRRGFEFPLVDRIVLTLIPEGRS